MSDIIKKAPEADLRSKSGNIFDLSMIGTMFFFVVFFFFARAELEDTKIVENVDEQIQVVEIPPTKQLTRPPPPARPQLPVEAEDDEEIDDVTIDDTEVDLTEEIPELEEEEEEEIVEFFAVQKKPEIIKKVLPKYPPIAQRAGIEGMVVVDFIVDEKGLPTQIKILKGHPMLDEAAINAVKQYRFSPGMQRDKPVKVKWRVPIRFRLKN